MVFSIRREEPVYLQDFVSENGVACGCLSRAPTLIEPQVG